MLKKDLITPFLAIGLSFLFGFICVMVFIHKGRSEKWVARKMLIGGLLLSLTASINSCKIRHTCYVAPAKKGFKITQANPDNEIIISNSHLLIGKLFDWNSQHASFIVANQESEIIQKGAITPIDGKIDSELEGINISISNKIKQGDYILMIYDIEESKINKNHYIHKFKLIIQ